jgi:hypothetical protein
MRAPVSSRTAALTAFRTLRSARAARTAAAVLGLVGTVSCNNDVTPPLGIPTLPNAEVLTTTPFQTLSSPNRGTVTNELKGVAAVSATDIWAVGEWNPTSDPASTLRRTLIEHWNGTSWQLVTSPNESFSGVDLTTLEAVATVSNTFAWAVGHGDDFSTLKSTTFILRWNGTQWSRVPSPNPGGSTLPNKLFDVAVVSATNAWAVGEQNYPQKALILHWNGTSWTNVANSCGGSLYGVTAISATSLLAVGEATTCRYNGASWTRVAPVEPVTLLDVAAVSSSLAWAVGRRVYCTPYFCTSASVLHRWNGSQWSKVSHPMFSTLNGIDAVTATDAWAVGDSASSGAVLHWNGTAWKQVPAPKPGYGSSLNAVDAIGATRTWAVGRFLNTSGIARTWTIRR